MNFKCDETGVINALGQTHSPARSDHYSHLKFVLFFDILKSGEGRTDVRTNVQTDGQCV